MKLAKIFIMIMLILCNQAKAAFVEGLEDFPIPDGLEQIDNANLNFGNEDIRLVEAYMTSDTLDFSDIIRFYKETLPQLGWKPDNKDAKKVVFERDEEIVEISEESSNPLIINLVLKSKK